MGLCDVILKYVILYYVVKREAKLPDGHPKYCNVKHSNKAVAYCVLRSI